MVSPCCLVHKHYQIVLYLHLYRCTANIRGALGPLVDVQMAYWGRSIMRGWRITGGRSRVGRWTEWRLKCGKEEQLGALTHSSVERGPFGCTQTLMHLGSKPWRLVVRRVHVGWSVWCWGPPWYSMNRRECPLWNVFIGQTMFSSEYCVMTHFYKIRPEELKKRFPSAICCFMHILKQ